MEERRRQIRVIAEKLGMNYYDIAEALGLSYYTIKQYLAPSSEAGPSVKHLKLMKQYAKEMKIV